MSLLLWSGGCDSTLMLWTLLQGSTMKTPGLPVDKVRTLSIVHYRTDHNKAFMERQSRKSIRLFLESMGYSFDYNEVEITRNDKYSCCLGQERSCGGLIEPLIWLPVGVQWLEEKEDLYAAYHRGDDLFHFLGQVQHIFSCMQQMLHKTGKLELLFEWHNKWQILRNLKQIGLYDLCWWCERPEGDLFGIHPCGSCMPCRTHEMAIKEMDLGWSNKQNKKEG